MPKTSTTIPEPHQPDDAHRQSYQEADASDWASKPHTVGRALDLLGASSGATVVTSAAVIADHRLVRGDGGARGIQDSGITVDDSDVVTGLGALTGKPDAALVIGVPNSAIPLGVTLVGGSATDATENGGPAVFQGGSGNTTGQGGVAQLEAGSGGLDGPGGAVLLIAGPAGGGDNDGGNVELYPGEPAGGGAAGVFKLFDGVSGFASTLSTAALAADRVHTLPDAAGTLAIESQHPLLLGRSGGQTLIGGTGSAESLTLQGTSHATPGVVIAAERFRVSAATPGTDADPALQFDDANLGFYRSGTTTRLLNFTALSDRCMSFGRSTLGGAGFHFGTDADAVPGTFSIGTGVDLNAGNVLFVDDSTGFVGIGTILPESECHIVATSPTSAARGLNVAQHNDGTQAALVNFTKSRGTKLSPTAVTSGDVVMALFARPYDGSNYQSAAFLRGQIDGAVSAGVAPTAIILGTGSASFGTARLTISSAGLFTVWDGGSFALGTTTGTKFGTATSQKIGFFNATPVVQPTNVANPAGGGTVDAEARTAIDAILSRLETLGLFA